MAEKDYYEILQVSPNADPEVIEAAYKRLALKYHPDRNNSPDAVQRMQEINEAYAKLSNTTSRYFYDIDYRRNKQAPPQPTPQPPPPQPTPQPKPSTPAETTPPKQKQSNPIINRINDFGLGAIAYYIFVISVVSFGVYMKFYAVSTPESATTQPLAIARSSTSTPVAIATNTQAATIQPTNNPRPTATTPACIPTSQITLRYVGDSICIIGTVGSVGRDNVAQYINFQYSDFQLITYDPALIIPFTAGACIQQRGQVQRLGNHPVMLFDIRDAYYKCDAPPASVKESPTAIVQAPAPTQPSSTNNTGQGQLTIINDTQRAFKFVFWGAIEKEVEVYSQPITLALPVGAYGWTAFSNGCQLDAAPNLIINPTNTLRAVIDDSPCGWRVYWNVSSPIQPPQASNNTISSPCPYGCDSPPAGCNIKGNIAFNTGEKIYHVPGGIFYNETTIDPRYGEKWFCTEQEAINNGWRRSSQ